MKNRTPRWSESNLHSNSGLELNAFVLDFKGKVRVPSVKNFLITDNEEKENYIMFGKNDENLFKLEVKWPFSLYQAFAIAISSLEK